MPRGPKGKELHRKIYCLFVLILVDQFDEQPFIAVILGPVWNIFSLRIPVFVLFRPVWQDPNTEQYLDFGGFRIISTSL
jgi:hypothetical protein